jgi:hypothetical protein
VNLEEAAAAVREAQEEYIRARDLESRASRDATSAVNRLKAAQKAFDDLAAKLRADAPRESDWKARERMKEARVCE